MPHSLIPCLRYENAPAAIDFLCEAFGFSRHAVFADPADPQVIHHAQLVLEDGMVMLSTVGRGGAAEEATARYGWRTAREARGVTMTVYAVVADPDAQHDRAAAAGADIIRAPYANEGYAGRSYEARDPEGNVWCFGNYDPWQQGE
jgi:uncharacterized glyoxalase superfamily protein PhnB